MTFLLSFHRVQNPLLVIPVVPTELLLGKRDNDSSTQKVLFHRVQNPLLVSVVPAELILQII